MSGTVEIVILRAVLGLQSRDVQWSQIREAFDVVVGLFRYNDRFHVLTPMDNPVTDVRNLGLVYALDALQTPEEVCKGRCVVSDGFDLLSYIVPGRTGRFRGFELELGWWRRNGCDGRGDLEHDWLVVVAASLRERI